ncbi:histone-lysine N-methyltransferase, H3 lysine-79 specific [Nymphalis io]|uniref:histone-lysine N-methyltransferase, H3 lysine-79 specific n=1 Tax=Inachis io TaxID=171585 RepID=UPI002169AE8E|nr:histone-lysine N-methyltransferase, H3 lysine-79 specific [Nymphalis io]
MLSVGKPVSLVQQKKQQWAQEREEMSHLYLPWGSGERYTNRLQVRNQFASSLELHKHSSYEYQEPIQRQRSPSLPPINNIELKKSLDENRRQKEILNRNVSSAKRFAFYDEDGEGDTSGYGSETINHMNIRNHCGTFHGISNNPVVAWHQEGKEKRKQPSSGRSGMTDGALSARSTSGLDEGRPRWGDRGVATGRLWEPTAPTARLPQMQNQKKGTPSWVERGLNMIDSTSEVLVVDQRSSTNSGLDYERSSYNGSDEGRTFLRGQNVPIEPEIKAQRETKRVKALELQSAILNQLEEREKLRQEERERKLREERIEELRIQKQREEDRLRLEDEKRKIKEKQLFEHRKLEALKKALEDAEKKAKQDKEKKFNCHRHITNSIEPLDSKESNLTENYETEQPSPTKTCSPTKTNRTYNLQTSENKENNSQQTTAFNSPRSIPASNLNLFIHNVPPLNLTDNKFNIVPIGITNAAEIINNQSNNIQLAVLLPQNKSLYSMSLNSVNNLHELEELEKVLTPSKYRTHRTKDAYTQTNIEMSTPVCERIEKDDVIRYVDKNYSKIDENAPQDFHRNTKKDRRLRSEERYKKDIESRPKWGANKPVAQYKKQSEKDPFYTQKRKIRQKYRPQVRQYVSQSSEDSRSPSPPTRSEKTLENNIKQRNSLSQSYWRSKRSSQDLSTCDNVVPEFTSLAQIGADIKVEPKKSPKLSPSKRLTLSQKFINDKYGSKKMWTDDMSEQNSKYSFSDLDNTKRNSEKLSLLKKFINEKEDRQDHNIEYENIQLKTQNKKF